MTVVSYVTKDGNETKSYAEAVKAGISEVKYTKWRDPEDEKAVQEQIEFWRKYKRAQPSYYFARGARKHPVKLYHTRCHFVKM